MIQTRAYQEQGITELRQYVSSGLKRVLLCMPTGSGKTVVFSSLVAKTLAKNMFARVLILTDRRELLQQAGGTLEKFGIRFEPIDAGNRRINLQARCYVGMVETYFKRIEKIPELLNMTLIIIDEAHKGAFKKMFAKINPATVVIGVTATPISSSKHDPLSNYYQAMVCPVTIEELIQDGHLVPAITYSAKIDRSALVKDSTGEYSDASQMATFAKRTVYAGLLEKYKRFGIASGRPVKTIIFNVNVEHSLAVTAEFNAAGIVAHHVDGTTPSADRMQILSDFKKGLFPVLCNVGILNAGFDDPSVEMVVVNRATSSQPLWLQMAGRGSRPHPGKDHFKLLDMGENYKELGTWEAERDWHAWFTRKAKMKEGEGVAPVKSCPSCEALIHASLRNCPHCDYEYPLPEPVEAVEAEFTAVVDGLELSKIDRREVWPTLSIEELEALRVAKNRKPGWVVHVIRERSADLETFKAQIIQLRDSRGYKLGWEKHVAY